MTSIKRTIAYQIMYFLNTYKIKGARFILPFVKKLLIPTPKGKAICNLPYGFSLLVDPIIDKGVERNIYFNGGYEFGTVEIMRKVLDKGDVFIDVGSNIGLMTLAASKFVSKEGAVYSFEAFPETYKMLSNNLILNKTENVRAYNLALGEKAEKSVIYSNMAVNRGSSSLIKPNDVETKAEEINVISLDEFIKNERIDTIKMVKIDVEGWESEVFRGAKELFSSKSAPIICFEYSQEIIDRNAKKLDLYKYLQSINAYCIFKLEYAKECVSKLLPVKSHSQLPKHDNLFCFLPSHLQHSNIKRLIKSN